jgi:DNA-directed RNA polymerase specialized sigma24 family protein
MLASLPLLPASATLWQDNSELLIVFGFVLCLVLVRRIDDSAPSPALAVALRHDLDAALRRLDPDEQTALHLFYQQGLSHPEIAAVARWPLGTVKTRLARGKDKLRQLLAAWNPQT